jgi:hypothetical protein
VTEQPDDREPPELQDTAERSALPLPVPGSDEETAGQGPPAEGSADEPAPIEDPETEIAPADDGPADQADDSPADKAAAVEEPPEASAPSHGDAPAGFGAEPTSPPSFTPPPFGAEAADEGMRPEILVGAAFLGGVALAFLIKRLGS